MKSRRTLSIWMDHTIAYLYEYKNNTVVTTTIVSTIRHDLGDLYSINESNGSLSPMPKPFSVFFQEISDVIIGYEDVILFGPTGSKNELFNHLLHNHRFDRINMAIQQMEQMEDPDREAFLMEITFHHGHRISSFQQRASSFFSLKPFGHFTAAI